MKLENLSERIQNHLQGPFPPGWRGKRVNDRDLTVLESEIAGGVLSAINGGGQLSTRGRMNLEQGTEALAEILKQLDGDALSYFARLHAIAAETLDLVPARAAPPK